MSRCITDALRCATNGITLYLTFHVLIIVAWLRYL
ncbi:hypothetical protein T4D_16690 [Trichinella pseudospiralis]|uniref:Uncharacterized protein n=1 Tax=Trichinella pseudospiralis TaxID=6337 RepID=A0A0V1DR65_TRIPS|nr:hypothetical protein T4D_16690 [Trichinella pseudospiralis]